MADTPISWKLDASLMRAVPDTVRIRSPHYLAHGVPLEHWAEKNWIRPAAPEPYLPNVKRVSRSWTGYSGNEWTVRVGIEGEQMAIHVCKAATISLPGLAPTYNARSPTRPASGRQAFVAGNG